MMIISRNGTMASMPLLESEYRKVIKYVGKYFPNEKNEKISGPTINTPRTDNAPAMLCLHITDNNMVITTTAISVNAMRNEISRASVNDILCSNEKRSAA